MNENIAVGDDVAVFMVPRVRVADADDTQLVSAFAHVRTLNPIFVANKFRARARTLAFALSFHFREVSNARW